MKRTALILLLLAAVQVGRVHAYTPLATSGVSGNQFAAAIDQRFNGTQTVAPQLDHYLVSTLPTEVNAMMVFANDGVPGTNPCAGGGGGAIAVGIAGAFACLPANTGQLCNSANTPCSATSQWLRGDATNANVTFNLPASTGTNDPISTCKVDASANTVTLHRSGTDTIQGAASDYALTTQHQCVQLVDTAATNWSIRSERWPGGPPLQAGSNLSDLTSAATARTNLALGTSAVANLPAIGAPGSFSSLVDPVWHAAPTASGTTNLTCTGISGNFPYNDIYSGALAGNNVTYNLPTSGCADFSIITEVVEQDAAHTLTNTTSASGGITGTQTWTLGSTPGNLIIQQFMWFAPLNAWFVMSVGTNPVQPFPVSVGGTGTTYGNGIVNIASPGGLTTSTTTETATTTATNPVVAFGAIGDFVQGQGVFMAHAGAAATVVAPAGLAGTLQGYQINGNEPTASVEFAQCNVDTSNAACATSYSVAVIAVDAKGGWSPATAKVTVASGPTTLSVWNSVKWTWTASTNAAGYIVLGCTGAACTPTSIWGITPRPVFWDFGNHFGTDITYSGTISAGVQTSGLNQDLSTTISSISGLNVTLAVAPGISGTFTAQHDNAPAIQAALTANASNGGDVVFPLNPSAYPVSELNFENVANLIFGGTRRGHWSASGTSFKYIGSAGAPWFYLNWAPGDEIHDLSLNLNTSSPGEIFDVDSDAAAGSQRAKGDQIRNTFVINGAAGAALAIDRISGAEGEFVEADDNQWSAGTYYVDVYIAGAWQSDNEEIDRTLLGKANFGLWTDTVGTVKEDNSDIGGVIYIAHYNSNFAKQVAVTNDYGDPNDSYYSYNNNGGGNTPNFFFSGSHVSGTPGPNGYIVLERGSSTWVGDSQECGGANNCLFGLTNNVGLRRNTFIGMVFATAYPAGYPATLKPPSGFPITEPGGVNSLPVFSCIGCVIHTASDQVTNDVISNGQASVWSGATASVLASTKDYIAYGQNAAQAVIATQANAQNTWAFGGIASNLICTVTTNAGATGDVFTVEQNGSATALTCTVANGTAICPQDTTHRFLVSPGDKLDIVANPAATNTNATGVASCAFLIGG